jgi:copper resistance protein B
VNVSALVAVAAVLLTPLPALAQMSGMAGGPASEAAPYGRPIDDQRVFSHVTLDQLEDRTGGGATGLRWMGEAWVGTDSDRIWLKSEGRTDRRGRIEDGQQELLYDRPITAYFDLQAGARYDLDSRPGRGWAALGVQGLAPYGAHVAITGYVGDKGRTAARLEASYDFLVTQRLVLTPQAELNAYGEADPSRRVGSGLSDLDAGIRLRFEITRKFAPYVGFSEERSFGQTAKLVRTAGDPTHAERLVLGLRTWF